MNSMTSSIVAFDTDLGVCAICWTDAGIASVRLPGPGTTGLPRLDEATNVPGHVRAAIDGIVEVLGGRPRDLGFVQLDERGLDDLQRAVYAATRRIAAGTTRTYGDVARDLGLTDPRSARDVGAALARNPFPVVVPCHRVVGANGTLTGFSAPGGLATKRRRGRATDRGPSRASFREPVR